MEYNDAKRFNTLMTLFMILRVFLTRKTNFLMRRIVLKIKRIIYNTFIIPSIILHELAAASFTNSLKLTSALESALSEIARIITQGTLFNAQTCAIAAPSISVQYAPNLSRKYSFCFRWQQTGLH